MQSLVSRIVAVLQEGNVSAATFDSLVARSKTYVGELYGADSWQLRHIESLATLEHLSVLSLTPERFADKLHAIAQSVVGMEQGRREAATAHAETDRVNDRPTEFDSESVFIVHGHDHSALGAVSDFLMENQLNPVVLKDEPNSGQTLLEKFLATSRVGFAIVLLTPDDLGGAVSQPTQTTRARQNVILELGYFIGAIGRERVAVLYVDGVELPSDIVGLAYISFDANGVWKTGLMLELTAAGYIPDSR